MRKFLITALAAGSMGVAGLMAMPAHATSTCTTGVSPSGTGGSAAVSTPIGCTTASGDAATQSGYVVADGVSSNPGALSGYIGVDGSDGPTVVGCSNGDYAPGGANHVVASQNQPPTVPPNQSDPCTPAPPAAP